MRISDWSSDVCSSDLAAFDGVDLRHLGAAGDGDSARGGDVALEAADDHQTHGSVSSRSAFRSGSGEVGDALRGWEARVEQRLKAPRILLPRDRQDAEPVDTVQQRFRVGLALKLRGWGRNQPGKTMSRGK